MKRAAIIAAMWLTVPPMAVMLAGEGHRAAAHAQGRSAESGPRAARPAEMRLANEQRVRTGAHTARAGTLLAAVPRVATAASPATPQLSHVAFEQGELQGLQQGDVRVFLGIPYAAPPLGELRWRAPQPPEKWRGIRDATHFGPSCFQYPATGPVAGGGAANASPYTPEFKPVELPFSEDCLSLNIWTPAKAAGEKLPVLVWIHGGAFRGGCGCVPVNDGSQLAAQGILVVTINYRVGPVGFLAHPELSRESLHNASGNYGLLDQIAALHWVQQNIAAFGGDPTRVTIGGQSAGATSVHDLIASPLARGLFRGAISESRYNMGYPDKPLATGEQEGIDFAAANGARNLAELRALPAETLKLAPRRKLTAALETVHSGRDSSDASTATLASNAPYASTIPNPLAGEEPRFAFVPVVDGWVLPADPEIITAQRKHNDTPVLIGITSNESNRTLPLEISPQVFRSQLQSLFGSRSDAAAKLYPASSPEEASTMALAVRLDRGLASLDAWASERLKAGTQPLFMYVFTRHLPVANGRSHGAFHAAEMPYAFDTLHTSSRPFTATDRALAAAMSRYWVNFVKHGDPNGAGLQRWPAFDAKRTSLMQLGDTIEARPILEPRKRDLFQAHAADRGRLSVF